MAPFEHGGSMLSISSVSPVDVEDSDDGASSLVAILNL